MKRRQFTFYRSFYEALLRVPEERRYEEIMALLEYALNGTPPPEWVDENSILFVMAKPTLDAARKKAKAGQKGGKAKASKQSGKKEEELENEIKIEIETESESQSNCSNVCDGFDRFWDQYPVKIGKDKALEMWLLRQPDADAVCRALEAWKLSAQWKREAGRFVPRAAKFLEDEQFRQLPDIPNAGAMGMLGQAELDAIAKIMREDV